jgi:hypothetical protein
MVACPGVHAYSATRHFRHVSPQLDETESPQQNPCMQALANGLYLLFNGAMSSIHAVVSPVTIAIVLCLGSLTWLATLETDELNRQGHKPTIERH